MRHRQGIKVGYCHGKDDTFGVCKGYMGILVKEGLQVSIKESSFALNFSFSTPHPNSMKKKKKKHTLQFYFRKVTEIFKIIL